MTENNTLRLSFSARVKILCVLCVLCGLSSFLACASAPTTIAEWDSAPAAIRQVFPDTEYIAQRGRGATRAAAEAQAAGELARFISSQITANKGYSITTNNEEENISTQDEAYVRSQINLFGIRYADDAYYRKDLKEWRTVAYIERDEAWTVYRPRFKQQADSFMTLYNAAEEETDPLRKTFRYMAADNYARSDEFTNANLFGQILHPRKMNEEFAEVRASISAIPQRMEEARRRATVYIDCPGDFESIVTTAFASRFSAMGFPVTNNRNTAAAICRVTIDEGRQQRELGIFYFPKVQAVVSSNAGVLFTYSAEAERAQAVTPDVAKRNAYQSLANKVNSDFSLEIN